MIRLIEAENFRCLKNISQPLTNFHILIGPNASGKSTFLDVIAFISDFVSYGLENAVNQRSANFLDLVWLKRRIPIKLSVEFDIPKNLQEQRGQGNEEPFDIVRYEIVIGLDDNKNELSILEEKVLLKKSELLLVADSSMKQKTIINKIRTKKDSFTSEIGKKWNPYFQLGPYKSALANLPEDETLFPIASWLKGLLIGGNIKKLLFNSVQMRKPSPPNQPRYLHSDGSNLAWEVEDLKTNNPESFKEWIGHLKIALPDLIDIKVIDRPEDRHRYLMICYEKGLEIPSWFISDGTLRLLGLTLLAYLPEFEGIYLIEEPENGVHPQAVETIFQSLSSVYDAQILIATHSPVFLSLAKPENLLCFNKSNEDGTIITPGNKHPYLSEWKGSTSLGVLFAGGFLE